MKLTDAVRVVGANTLASFPWGMDVVRLVNSFLADDKQLTDQSTGDELQAAIDGMPAEQQAFLLAAAIDSRKAKVIPPTDAQVMTPVAVAPPKDDDQQKRSIALGVCLVILIVAVIMTFSIPGGGKMDGEAFGSLVKNILDFLQAVLVQPPAQ